MQVLALYGRHCVYMLAQCPCMMWCSSQRYDGVQHVLGYHSCSGRLSGLMLKLLVLIRHSV